MCVCTHTFKFIIFFPQFQQIVKILNAHTDSLGWIDRETALLRQKVDDVAKVTEYRKREQERSFRLVSLPHINKRAMASHAIDYVTLNSA